MNDQAHKSVPFNWPNLLLLVAVAGNLLWLQSPLRSSRPSEKETPAAVNIGDQDAEARLWQDPFEAVLAYQKKTKFRADGTVVTNMRPHDVARLKSQIHTRLKSTDKSVTIMPIMTTGSPYVEGNEWRLRSRYAALSALQVAGYVPEDREHVGYAIAPWPHDPSKPIPLLHLPPTNSETTLLAVPFEWFKTNSLADCSTNASGHVLILWLKDELFEDAPLERLGQLIAAIRPDDSSASGNSSSARMRVKVIGPWSSGTLQAMLNEQDVMPASISMAGTTNSALSKVEMFSASATAADALLLNSNAPILVGATNEEGFPRENITDILEKKGIAFHNAICTDDQLCGALVRELARRGVHFAGAGDRVALISEWDTTYGRSLPEVFYRAVSNLYRNPNSSETISRFSYLRGVDGKLPGGGSSASAEPSAGTNGTSQNKHNQGAGLQLPEGRSQLDYVPRLVQELKREEQKESKDHKGKLKAIGILGSDVYDKLLLLQSLRENFPQAIFFTTDLDARLFHPSQLKWSRNLVVASSFGLELNSDLQKGVPPFRDSYQTAEYLACLKALGCYPDTISAQLSPRLFEIGQRGAYDLSTTDRTIYPRRTDIHTPFFSPTLLEVIIAIFFALLLLYQVSPQTRAFFRFPYVALLSRFDESKTPTLSASDEKLAKGTCGILTLVVFVIVVGFVVLVWLDQRSPAGEPFTLFDGISIWPAELARMFTFCLCIGFFIKAWRDLQTNSDELGRAFGSYRRKKSTKADRVELDGNSITEWVEVSTLKTSDDDEADVGVSAAEVWAQYKRRGTLANRCRRFIPHTAYYVILGLALMALLGFPHIPYRGTMSLWLDHVALLLSVTSLILLIFFVVDATRLCARFIHFTEGKTDWGEAAVTFSERMEMPKEYLDDWLDIHFITGRTRVVCRLIYYPFIILLIMILSRANYFDSWDWPLSLMLVLGMNSAFAIYCAIYLRREAEKARRRALTNLNEKLCAVLGGKSDEERPVDLEKEAQNNTESVRCDAAKRDRAEQIRLLIRQIETNDEGAFAPFSHNPIVGALLMPFGGAGILALLDFITTH